MDTTFLSPCLYRRLYNVIFVVHILSIYLLTTVVTKMDLTWIFSKQEKEIIEELYEQHRKNEGNEEKELYYETSLAKALDKQRQAISRPLGTLIERGIITVVKVGPGPDKGQVRYLDLTDDGIAIWKHSVLPTVAEIKKAIKKIHDAPWKYGLSDSSWKYGDPGDLSELAHRVAIERGRDPDNDKPAMALIYAVMSMPDVRELLEKGAIPRVVPLRR